MKKEKLNIMENLIKLFLYVFYSHGFSFDIKNMDFFYRDENGFIKIYPIIIKNKKNFRIESGAITKYSDDVLFEIY